MQAKTQNTWFKFTHKLSLWSLIYFKILQLIHKIIDKPVVCDINCDACKAFKLRRQFSLRADEEIEMLTVSHGIN